MGPPGLDSQAASFTVLQISDRHFGKVTPELILSNPLHGHRLIHPSILLHPSLAPNLTLWFHSQPLGPRLDGILSSSLSRFTYLRPGWDWFWNKITKGAATVVVPSVYI